MEKLPAISQEIPGLILVNLLSYYIDLIAEALGYEYGNKVTGIYLDNYDNLVIDEANAKVIEAVFK